MFDLIPSVCILEDELFTALTQTLALFGTNTADECDCLLGVCLCVYLCLNIRPAVVRMKFEIWRDAV